MEFLEELFEQEWITRIINSLIVIIISVIAYNVINKLLIKLFDNKKAKILDNRKSNTYKKLIKSIVKYIIIILTVLSLLQINGVNISSMLAGVGILGIVVGFAIQDALKDIIKGIDIISDSYYRVGDVIKYDNIEGKVLSIGLKTTKVQSLSSGNVISIANRNIEKVEVVSEKIHINIPMPYEVKLEKAEKAIDDILNLIKENEKVLSCRYLGVNNLADSSIQYLIEVCCNSDIKLQIRRDSLKCIINGLDKNNIEVPYNQLDIHNK